jgi:parallel beta helix pectate lyase-like protein/thrombospondin type 3 repeat protein
MIRFSRRFCRLLFAVTLGLAGLGANAGVAAAQAAVRVVDDDRVQCPQASATDIQTAVANAPAGSRIEVCPGLYLGPVVIDKPLHLLAVSQPGMPHVPQAAVHGPTCVLGGVSIQTVDAIVRPTGPRAVFELSGHDSRIEGFYIQDSARAGVQVLQAGTGNVLRRNVVQDNGVGIAFGSTHPGTSEISENCVRRNEVGIGTAQSQPVQVVRIVGNHFTAQRREAISLASRAGFGSLFDVTVADNDVTGAGGGGLAGFLAILGGDRITVARNEASGAGTVIALGASSRVTIEENTLSSSEAGIRFLQGSAGAASQTAIEVVRNKITGMHNDGIVAHGSSATEVASLADSRIAGNTITANAADGIYLGLRTVGNLVEGNFLRSNVEHDCHDDSVGTGTAGTGNTWRNNDALTENRPGLCTNRDGDGDGVPDAEDNCPAVANPDQTDTDGDGMGNACDPDDDNDGVADGPDNCELTANPDQTDKDGDGMGNACDPDDDNDNVPDAADNCPMVANADQRDTDSDGIGDACDPTPGSTPGCAGGLGTLQTNPNAGFAFGVRYRAGAAGPEGLLGFTDRSAARSLTSGRITSMIIVGSHASIRGEGRANGGQTVAFKVEVDDLSANGSLDTFTIEWPGYSATGTLRAGNITLTCPRG